MTEMTASRRTALALAGLMALLEVVDAFSLDVPAAAIVVGALFVVGVVLDVKGRAAGLWVLAALFAIEVVFLPAYGRSTTWDWVMQGTTGVISAVGLVATVITLLARRRRRAPVQV